MINPCDIKEASEETKQLIAGAIAANWIDIRMTRSFGGLCGWSGIPPIPGRKLGEAGSHGVKRVLLSGE